MSKCRTGLCGVKTDAKSCLKFILTLCIILTCKLVKIVQCWLLFLQKNFALSILMTDPSFKRLMKDLSFICVFRLGEIVSLVFRCVAWRDPFCLLNSGCLQLLSRWICCCLSVWDADKRMPFAFEILHLASGKRVHNLAKKGKLFVWFYASGRLSDQVEAPLMLKYTHYTYKIVCQRKK